MSLRSSRVHQLADAAMAIAYVNHYLVGFVDVHSFTVEEFQEANAELIDRELNNPTPDQYDLAFEVLDAACFALHHVHLSK